MARVHPGPQTRAMLASCRLRTMASPMTTNTAETRYQVGQRWRCQGRTADENPILLINEISIHPRGGQIFHISLQGINIHNPRTPGVALTEMVYLPVAVQTLEHSGLEFLDEQPVNPAYREGRQQWQVAFDAGNAAVYGNTIAAITQLIEKQLNGIPNTPPRH